MKGPNPLTFAVVREDPGVEIAAIEAGGRAEHACLIASGGCTALALQALYPEMRFTLVDSNPAQINHVRRKVAAMLDGENVWGIGAEGGLSTGGRFESLFRIFRTLVHEHIAEEQTLLAIASGDLGLGQQLVRHPWWSTAFEVCFSDSMLLSTFGPAAIQHAPRGTYPRYFQAAIARGIQEAGGNCFLDHVLLGYYRPESLPLFLQKPAPDQYRFDYFEGDLSKIPSFDLFDLIHLSNILDWADNPRWLCEKLNKEAKVGARITLRQLNNRRELEADLPAFKFKRYEGSAVGEVDRSLFYERILIGTKQ